MEIQNTQQPSFDTVTEALDWLKIVGYSHDFNLDGNYLKSANGQHSLSPEDFTINYVFRFEGDSDPDDESIIYGISSETYKMKGVMISAFGMYADSISNEMIQKLAIRNQ